MLVRRVGLLRESDIKKLIAYSTLRHVSLIMLLISMKLFKVVYFHLNIHAMFKSTMFMCFGFVMLTSYHRQDKRLASLVSLNPLIKIIYYFSCLCLIGLPFLRGFFSKDFIVEKIIEIEGELVFIILLLLFLAIRVYYGLKLLRLVNIRYSYRVVEKNYVGIFRVVVMISMIVIIVNVFVRLIIRLRLEVVSFKIRIYMVILLFMRIRLLTSLNFKFIIFDKIKGFKEVWRLDVYIIEKFIY